MVKDGRVDIHFAIPLPDPPPVDLVNAQPVPLRPSCSPVRTL